jgi:DNA-binding MarR family transcriptional regulator
MISLTNTEAKLLRVLNESSGSSYHQLASGAELTPSEVSRAVHNLVEKELAQPVDDKPILTLTDQGRLVRRSMERHWFGFGRSRDFVEVSVIPDEPVIKHIPHSATDRTDVDIDAALDEVIRVMRRG